MSEIATWALGVAALIVFFAALVQASVGFGFNILAVPLMSILDPALAPNPQLVVSLVLATATVLRERQHLRLREVLPILAGRPVGAVAGALVLGVVVGGWLDLTIAVIVLAAVAILAGDIAIKRNRITQAVAGALSGFTSIVSAIGGPPLMLLYRDERGVTARTQLGVVFMVGGFLSIVLRTWAGAFGLADLWIGLLMVPSVFIGFYFAARVHPHVDRVGLRWPVLGLSVTAAVVLLIRSLI